MATDKRGRKLPRGIRATQNGFEGRFMFRGTSYSVSGKTVREVQQRLTEARYKAEHGVIVSPDVITFAAWAETWFREYYVPTVRESTAAMNRSTLTANILPALGSHRLADIRSEHINAMLNDMAARNYSYSVVKRVKSMTGRIFIQALRNGLIERNPAEGVATPRVKAATPHVALTAAQQATFMEYAKDSYFRDMFALALRTGMRIGEVLALRTTDIDFRKNVIHILRTVSKTSHGLVENEPKTRTSRRDIPISSGTAQLLRDHIRHRLVASIDQRMFCDWDGRKFKPARVNDEIHRIIRRIREDGHDMPDFSFHTLRHTFATRAIEAGMNPQTLKTILGHSSLAMTMDLYAHVMEDTKAKEMEDIDRVFNGC